MKNVARIGAVVFLLFAGLSSPKASAIVFYCDDICSSQGSCALSCKSQTGVSTTCGQWGCCAANQTNC